MTNKTTMPEPVCYRKLEYKDGELIDVEYNGIDQFSFGRKNGDPLITTEQAEAYANARVREALEEAARQCWLLRCSDEFEPEIQDRLLKQAEDRIRALIPKEDA